MANRTKISGAFTSAVQSESLATKAILDSDKALTLSLIFGGGSATVDVVRSHDGGSTWQIIESHTADVEKNLNTPSDYFVYALDCSTFGSGSIAYFMAN